MNLNHQQIELLTDLRQRLHLAPELSGSEINTAQMVKEFLAKHTSAKIIENVGGCGLLAVFESGADGDTLVLRAELDALPIRETSGVGYESGNDGIAHSCGHDGHMAILCGLALRLHEDPIRHGTVGLIFQPAEETGEGSERVLSDPKFTSLKPDQIIALHNIPGHNMGEILWKEGVICAASTGMQIEFEGMTSHAAHPELGLSPWGAIKRMSDEILRLNNTLNESGDRLKTTLVGVQMGGPHFGTSPGSGSIWLTIRSFSNETLFEATKQLEKHTSEIAEEFGLSFNISYHESFDATMNTSEMTKNFKNWMIEAGLQMEEKSEPFSWSEDFGRFTSAYNGFLFGLGAGKGCAPLHASDYNFPDEIIQTGVKAFEVYLRNQLK